MGTLLPELTRLVLAGARVMPTVALVPAFGLRALSVPLRAVVALSLAASMVPALSPLASVPVETALGSAPFYWLVLEELLRGLPVALAAAIPLWAATMAGGLIDALRGSPATLEFATVHGKTSSFGVLLSLFASSLFLSTGGAARVAMALLQPSAASPENVLLHAARDVTAGVTIAVAIAAPVLAAAVVLEVGFALVARATSPASVHVLFAPIRGFALLAIVVVVFERLATFLALLTQQALAQPG